MSPQKLYAALLLTCLPLAAAAQLPALTDSAEGQTLSTDTTWEAGDVVTIDTLHPLPTTEPPVYQHIVRSYIVDSPLSDLDLPDLLHLPAWTGSAAPLSPWSFSLWSLSPFCSSTRPAWAVWVGALLLVLAGTAGAALYALRHPQLRQPAHDDIMHRLLCERQRSLTAAVLVAAGGALFLHWPALAAGALIALYACRHYHTCRRHLRNVPPNPPTR